MNIKEDKKIKIYHVQGWSDYSNWIPNRQLVTKLEDADLVIFEGGEDVDPSIYYEKKHYSTHSNLMRDEYERVKFDRADYLGKKILGICRGSQFLCARNGGILVQDQPNPNYIHKIKTYDRKELFITSTHHQAAYPFRLPEEDYKVLAWTENMLPFHKGGMDEELNPKQECEIVFYPKTKSLGIQGHPEMLFPPNNNDSHETIIYLQDLLNKFMNDEL